MATPARSRRVRAIPALLLLAGVAALCWLGWDLHRIRTDLAAGQASLTGLSVEDAEELGEVTAAAASHLDAAADRAASSPVLGLLARAPLLGDQVGALRSITADAASIGELARGSGRRIDGALEASTSPEGRVALLEVLSSEVGRLADGVDRLASAERRAPAGPIGRAVGRFEDELRHASQRLGEASEVLAPVRDLLEGPSTHLLLAANNAEMAGGAGLTLSAGLLHLEDGAATLGEMVPAGDLRHPPGVPAPEALRRLYETTGIGLDLRSTTRSPDLSATGPVAAALAEAQGWGPVDGVLVIDAVALAELLEATGPVQASGVTVDAANVLEELLHEGYRRADRSGDAQGRFDHQSRVARAVVDALERPEVAPADLAGALLDAAAGRHLLAWAEDEDLQRAWSTLGVAGELPADGLLISFQNHGADKMDWYLRPEAALDVRRRPDGDLRARLTLTMDVPDRAETDGATPYILGPTPDDHEVLLSLHLPAAAREISTTHPDGFHRKGSDGGLPVRTFLETVPAGQSFERVVHFTLPEGTSSLTLVPSARVEPLPLTVDGVAVVDDDVARPVTWLVAWSGTDASWSPATIVATAVGALAAGGGIALLGARRPRRRAGLRPR